MSKPKPHELGDFVFRNGPYGMYMMKKTTEEKGGKTKTKKPAFVSIPSGIDVSQLTIEAAKRIYENGIIAGKINKKYSK
jgi:topoisomerase IA-like protein